MKCTFNVTQKRGHNQHESFLYIFVSVNSINPTLINVNKLRGEFPAFCVILQLGDMWKLCNLLRKIRKKKECTI